MATADAELGTATPRPYVPWTQRWIRASGISPWAAGAVLAGLQLASLFVVFSLGALAGFDDLHEPWFWDGVVGPNLVNALLIGYAPAAMAWSRRAALAELERLRPVLDEADLASFQARLAGFPRAPLAWLGVGTVALFVPLLNFDPRLAELFAVSSPLMHVWVYWVNALVGWLMVRSIFEELRTALLFHRIGARVAGVDLFDLGPLEPFARRAAEGVLVWVVGASLISILFAGEWDAETLPEIVASIVLAALVTFALPLTGVHRRIRKAKHEELARIHAAARSERADLLAGGPGARLPALLALRSQVADVREWPVDLSTLLRLLAYLAIGLGSWVGAALVEVGIDAVLK